MTATLLSLLTAEATRLKDAALAHPRGSRQRRELREQMFDVLAAKQAVAEGERWRATPNHTDIEEPVS